MSATARAFAGRSVSDQFERFVLALVLLLAVFRLVMGFTAHGEVPIPDSVTLSLTLGLMLFIWFRELKARHDLTLANAEMQQAEIDTITALVNSVEAKDRYTRGHSERVQNVATALARRLRLDGSSVMAVARAAILHDVGKLGIDEAILNKEGPLTAEEWIVFKSHPETTRQILAPLRFLSRECEIASMHHERQDGTGYGRGLNGHQIPVETAIISVADTFDAMNSDRPYRNAMSRDTILDELRKGRGTQHPAHIVDCLIGLLDEDPAIWGRRSV